MGKEKKRHYCVDCGAEIRHRSTRCCSCANKKRWADGVFDNNEYRRKQAEGTQRRWDRGDMDGIHDSEEWRRKQSKAQQAAHARGCYGEEWLQKKSQAMKATYERGELFTKEHRQKLAERARERWKSGSLGNEEWRRKNSEATKRQWERGDFDGAHNEEWRRKVSEALSAAWERGAYDGVFQSPTSIELQVAAALDIVGVEHTPQYRPEGYSRIFDEFIAPNTLIEVQGDYWHGDKCPDNQERDVEKVQWAEEHGFKLLIIWEHEIEERGAWAIIAGLSL